MTQVATDQQQCLVLDRLHIENVRNIESAVLDLHPRLNYFHGPNGAGKTSILEAIYILAHGKTFRHGRSENWISHGQTNAQIIIEYHQCAENHAQASATGFASAPGHRLGILRGRREWLAKHDGEKLNTYAELSRLLPLVLFAPHIHQLIEAGPEHRRQFLDWGVFHVEPDYLQVWRRYQKALKQRNASLKIQSSDAVVRALEPVMAETAAVLHSMRRVFFQSFAAAYIEIQNALDPEFEHIELQYDPGFESIAQLREDWQQHLLQDRQRGYTFHGPQRADIKLHTGSRAARGWLSSGQQKIVALTMLLAKQRTWSELVGKSGLLLLDDIRSELDAYHYQRLLLILANKQHQVLMTGTSAAGQIEAAGKVFHVEHGVASASQPA